MSLFKAVYNGVVGSVRWKLSLSFAGIIGAVVLAGGVVLVMNQRHAQFSSLEDQARTQALTGAAAASMMLESALDTGALTRDQLFDTNYQEIPGTSPKQYHTAFDAFTDKEVRAFEDSFLHDRDVTFAAMVDRNGYLPTHNTKFSVAGSGTATDRSKRIFNDPVGLAAAQNTKEASLLQTYKRDTGERLWDVSAPIMVHGEHWGAMRVGYSLEKVNSAVAKTTWAIVALVGIVIVVVAGVAWFVARKVANATTEVAGRLRSLQDNCLTDLQAAMTQMADGDLTVKVTPVTPRIPKYSRDELGRMAASVNEIIDRMVATIERYNAARVNLSYLIADVKENAVAVLDSARDLNETSGQLSAASDQIAAAMGDVSASSIQLSDVAHASAEEVESLATHSERLAADSRSSAASASGSRGEAADIGARIQAVAKASRDVTESAEESRSAAVTGAQALHDAIESMQTIGDAVQRASTTVNQLGTYGKQIGEIVRVIDDIAAQTNLLALNAAIESARAGEHGRGFAVVAENVRQLAQRSSDSTKEIAELIAKVQQGTEDAVTAMSAGVEDVVAGRAVAAEASDAIASIISSVEKSAEAMGQIANDVQGLASGAGRIVDATASIAALAESSAESAEGMAQGTERVSLAISRVAEMSERTSAATEQVSASTEELTAQSEELSGTAARMRELAATLDEAARKFRWDRRERVVPVAEDRRHNTTNVLSA